MILVRVFKNQKIANQKKCKSTEEANAWIQEQEKKARPWNHLPGRWLNEQQVLDEGKQLSDAKDTREITVDDAPSKTEYFFSKEYEYIVTDLSKDPQWLEKEAKRKRSIEYSKIDNLLKEAMVEKELGDDTKWQEYIQLREIIKAKYPKS